MVGYIYKITILNKESSLYNHFYIGQKQGTKIIDTYWGSGSIIQDYYRKHLRRKTCRKLNKIEAEKLGLHREILAYANTIEELNDLEAKYVNPELNNKMCLNLMTGGTGRIVKREVIDKMSKKKRDSHLHFWTNGKVVKMSNECPGEDFRRGRALDGYEWYNNGSTNVYTNKLIDGFVKGKLGTTYGKKPWNSGLTKDTHTSLMTISIKNRGRPRSIETREKLSNSLKGHCYSPNTTFKKGNIPWSKGLKGKGILKSNKTSFHGEHKGTKWYNNGKIAIRAFIKPEGEEWKEGMLNASKRTWYNNGKINKLYLEKPEENDWKVGRVKVLKPSDEVQQEIFTKYKAGKSPYELAKEYGFNKKLIKNTIKRIEKRMKNEK